MGKILPQYSGNGRKWRAKSVTSRTIKIVAEVFGQRFSSSQFKVKELGKNSERKRHYPEGRETTIEGKN